MNADMVDIPKRILSLALAALRQANTHAVYADPGFEHRGLMCVVNAAHAGELVLKAVIANEHPLLIFKDLQTLYNAAAADVSLQSLLENGRTYELGILPKILWVTTGLRLPDETSFNELRKARNAIQHFCAPPRVDLQEIALNFIYKNIDPILFERFNRYAIEYHEDPSVSYDYVVSCLFQRNLRFSFPPDFHVSEIDLTAELQHSDCEYRRWVQEELARVGKQSLLRR